MSSLYKKLLNEPSSWEVHLNVTSDYTFVVGVDASSGEITMIDCQGHPSDKKKYNYSTYGTVCTITHPYSKISHLFTVTTTSKKSYDISTSTDLTVITNFYKNK